MASKSLVRGFDPTPIKKLVLNAVSSPLTRVMYSRALDDFFAWWITQGRPPFARATIQSYRMELEAKGLASSSINQKLSAIRKLAAEASQNGFLDSATASSIRDVGGVRQQGRRTGNWLSKEQAERLLRAPDETTLKGRRDRALLALLIGCGLRREEAARLTFDHVQQRDGRWCIVDLAGKHGRIRTIPMPAWAKFAMDQWLNAAKFSTGRIFRGVNKGDCLTGESLTAQGILRCVTKYAGSTNVTVSPHDLRRTYAKLAHKGGAKLDQIQLSLGHASLTTTERYLGLSQNLRDAPCDYLGLRFGHRRESESA